MASPTRSLRGSAHLFTASRPVSILDHFRVPYGIATSGLIPGVDQVRCGSEGPMLMWPHAPVAGGLSLAATLHVGESDIPIFGDIAVDTAALPLLAKVGGAWEARYEVSDTAGDPVGAVWQRDDGSLFLPFDPGEVRLNFLSERYHELAEARATRTWRRRAMRGYYRARGVMPRGAQLWLRRRYAVLQARTPFPRWPIEAGFHDFLDVCLSLLQSIADEPVPRIAPWPNGQSWAFVLTHDVETAGGVEALDRVAELERDLGFRSCWNFVPRRYEVAPDLVQRLRADGFEVGVHGLYHDGRDLESAETVSERLPGMREAAARWGATGFRSPATHRDWRLMPILGFDYDSSYPDTDPFEPQGGGCCTWLPFFNDDMVELPLTMAQDHTLFEILRHRDETAWLHKTEYLRSRGGMVLLDTHPDYLADDRVFAAYQRYLERFVNDCAWRALPCEVSSWWRRRAESVLKRSDSGWVVLGPAAPDASIELTPPPSL